LFVFVVMFICYCVCLQSCLLGALWDEYGSCAVTERPHDASCLSVVSFKMHGGLCDKRTCTLSAALETVMTLHQSLVPKPDMVENCEFCLPYLHSMPPLAGPLSEYCQNVWYGENYLMVKKGHRPHLCIALCGKNGHNFHHETFRRDRQWLLDQVTAPCSVYSEAGTACFSLFSDVCCLSSCYLKNTNV